MLEINYDNPESVVSGFIESMNKWEIESDNIDTKYRDSGNPEKKWDEIRKNMDMVFASFCTEKQRPYGRQGSYQRPPGYDPKNETIVESCINKNRAHVITNRNAILGGGKYKYVLHKKSGKWLIDNVKNEQDGKFVNSIL